MVSLALMVKKIFIKNCSSVHYFLRDVRNQTFLVSHILCETCILMCSNAHMYLESLTYFIESVRFIQIILNFRSLSCHEIQF